MKIFAALENDVHQGWIWLQDSTLPPRCVIKITNQLTQKSVFCEALQIDENFLKNYNQYPRLAIDDPKNSLVIGAWYRAKLGGLSTQSDAQLKIKKCDSWFGKFMACIHHPQVVVRLAAWLGILGVVLGLLSLLC